MAQTAQSVTFEVEDASSTPTERSNAIPIDPPRNKSRTKLLQGLQRISSSSSITQLGRRRAVSNPYNGKPSLSCVSLASSSSPRNYDSSYSSHSSAGVSTAPTSIAGSPALTPYFDMPIRKLEKSALSAAVTTPTSTLPLDMRPASRNGLSAFPAHSELPEIVEDYFSLTIPARRQFKKRKNFNFWKDMPHELQIAIFSYLQPKELVRASIINKDFHKTCFDGQLWTSFDASEFYKDIPAESLAKIIVAAGPFVKDLNLRGCVQVEHYDRAEVVVKACKNLVNATLEGCRNIQRSTLHSLLRTNERLANLNLTGLVSVTNSTCKVIAQSCPSLESFDVSWCSHMDARGLRTVILGCPQLKDLRAREVSGFNNVDLAQDMFETNRLERLVLSGCSDITDQFMRTMVHGQDPEIDVLTDLPMVPVRRLRHLDLTRCSRLTNSGVRALAHFVPDLEGLQLNSCALLTDQGLSGLFDTTPRLTHLDIEELSELSNTLFSEHLAKAPCASVLEHLSISYCENVGDTGMLPVIRACTNLRTIDMDNTKISDLVLAEAASMIRDRALRTTNSRSQPRVGLHMVVFDCANVTWTGIREVLSRNAEIKKPTSTLSATYPTEIISMKCFYGWQMTVEEHTKRVLKGDLPAAGRLERKWAEYMVANEEAGADGAGVRRRRRRAREAQMMHADEEEGGVGMAGIGRRRRARSNGGCMMM